MIKIQDYNYNEDIGKYLDARVMTFNLTPENGVHIYWSIYTEEGAAPGHMIKDGHLHMDKELYDNWGDDDNYVIDWMLGELGLVK